MSDKIGNAGKPRILAFIIDNLLASVLAFLVVALAGPRSPVLGGAIVCIAYLSYFFAFEALWSRTPGKLFQGLEVRKSDGTMCSAKAAAIRTLARILEVNPILLGALPAAIAILSTKRKQRIGDLLADTVVCSKGT